MRTCWIILLALAPAAAPAPPLAAQEARSAALPELLPRDAEIALARSAAPPIVSDRAAVLVLERGGYVVAEEGTNGVTCYVSRTHPRSLEPHCFDAEGSRTILPIHVREIELRHQGHSEAEIDAAVAASLSKGELVLPRRPVLSYMMSPDQVLYDGERPVGAWKPHLMIYYPYLTAAELGLDEMGAGGTPMVFESGAATASLVIVVPEFAPPAATRSPGG